MDLIDRKNYLERLPEDADVIYIDMENLEFEDIRNAGDLNDGAQLRSRLLSGPQQVHFHQRPSRPRGHPAGRQLERYLMWQYY